MEQKKEHLPRKIFVEFNPRYLAMQVSCVDQFIDNEKEEVITVTGSHLFKDRQAFNKYIEEVNQAWDVFEKKAG